ncbi:MAG: fibronectin type III domain-containing protein [Acidimicrobiales bacterium]
MALLVVAAACVPFFPPGSAVTIEESSGVVAVQWPVALEVDENQAVDYYEIEVDGVVVGTVDGSTNMCVLSGLDANTTYEVAVSAYDTVGDFSSSVTAPDYQDIFHPSGTITTSSGLVGGTIVCETGTDTDGDRLPDVVETGTNVFVSTADTGTSPTLADTDGDSILDGDEVLGTIDQLDLPALGVSPLRKDLLLEFDWFDDSLDGCGAHSHQPTATAISIYETPLENAPVANPDGSTGINVISDYGQGGLFVGGNLIADPNGVIAGGVSGGEFLGYKSANFAPERNGYFHYVLLPHRYNTSSGSSGQAELNGDDMIVSLYCFGSDYNVGTTTLHELGHNLGLHHGGFESRNHKPNYNSVMNYAYQFPGVDNNCTPPGDGVIDFSSGGRADLDENNLDETIGICGGVPWDWNGDTVFDTGVVADINDADGSFTVLSDHDDWANLVFTGINDGDGAVPGESRSVVVLELISDQPIPPEYRTN